MNYKDYIPYLVYLFLNLITYIFIKLTSYSLSSTFNAIFSLLSISSFLLLVRTKQDPGEIEINSKGILERQITLSDSSIKLKYTPLMIMKLMPCNGCKFCKISELPLRSNHCEKCERCIRKYDHHCKLIGGCIGENNHLVFVLFLFTQSLIFVLGIFALIKRLSVQQNFVKFLMFGYIAIIGFIVSVFGIYFIFHIYLLLTNQTTYEIFHKNQCPYLRIFKQERIKIYLDRGIELGANFSFHPFDSGIRKNIGYAFYKLFNTDGMKWEDIYFRNLKSNHVKFDYCDNKILSAF
jgi:palmitoyltransferase